jgi:hypothetical protein
MNVNLLIYLIGMWLKKTYKITYVYKVAIIYENNQYKFTISSFTERYM